jgi:hypothetical protein
MTDEDMEGFEPEAAPDDAGDPAAAFEALRRSVEKQGAQLGAEMTIIRRGVEAAFDKFEKFKEPTDYGSDLGKIIQFLAVIEERLEAIEQSPVLRNGPEHYAHALERGGESLVSTAARQLERQAIDLERSANSLARRLAGARERYVQDRWLWSAGAAGLVAGVLLTLFLPRALPGSVDMAVASTVMNDERWKAGISLMQSGNPGGWQSIVDASNLVRANTDALTRCAEAAAKAKKDQSCTITVAAPAR